MWMVFLMLIVVLLCGVSSLVLLSSCEKSLCFLVRLIVFGFVFSIVYLVVLMFLVSLSGVCLLSW